MANDLFQKASQTTCLNITLHTEIKNPHVCHCPYCFLFCIFCEVQYTYPWKFLPADQLCENKGVKPQYLKWNWQLWLPFYLYFINDGIQSVSKLSLSVQNYFQISLTKTILCVSFKVGSCPSCHFDLVTEQAALETKLLILTHELKSSGNSKERQAASWFV